MTLERGPLRRASLTVSKTDRRPKSNNRRIGDLPYGGINGIDHAAAGAKDILEVGLNDPAGTHLRLIGKFERQLISADRQRFASEKGRVSIKAGAALGVSDGLLRLSAGLEDAGDLIADLDQALAVLDRANLAAE